MVVVPVRSTGPVSARGTLHGFLGAFIERVLTCISKKATRENIFWNLFLVIISRNLPSTVDVTFGSWILWLHFVGRLGT